VNLSSPEENRPKISEKPHVCPWWVGYFLLIPFRQISQNPQKILGPHVREGMTVLEVGPGMGFFTLTLARFVGGRGHVVCVDVQEKMLKSLRKRARRAGLVDTIETRLASDAGLHIDDLSGTIDFLLAFAVVHEVPDKELLFKEMHRALKSRGQMLLSEPTGHVTQQEFNDTLAIAREAGFETVETLKIRRSFSVLMRKESTSEDPILSFP
jgi:ubiquinone/menaquinone biosynthesis C-methylase UbiE